MYLLKHATAEKRKYIEQIKKLIFFVNRALAKNDLVNVFEVFFFDYNGT